MFSRVPVFEQRVDNIVGIAYAMDLLDYVRKVCAISILPYLLEVQIHRVLIICNNLIACRIIMFDFEG